MRLIAKQMRMVNKIAVGIIWIYGLAFCCDAQVQGKFFSDVALSFPSQKDDRLLQRLLEIENEYKIGSPDRALQEINSLILEAEEQRLWPIWIRARLLQLQWDAARKDLEPRFELEKMLKLVEDSPRELKPFLYVIGAYWLWSYFSAHQWNILERGDITEDSGITRSIVDWGPRTFLFQINKLFKKALLEEECVKVLQASPLKEYKAILLVYTLPDHYMPSIFDLAVNEAVKLYTTIYQIVPQPEASFEVKASDPIFAPVEQFLEWEIKPEQLDQPLAMAVYLLQKRLYYHIKNGNEAAAAEADLTRLKFGWLVAGGADRQARYLQALSYYVNRWTEWDIVALAYVEWARVLQSGGDLKAAHSIASLAVEKYPNSNGAAEALAIIRQIERPELRVELERQWWKVSPEVYLHYRNLETVHIHIIPIDWEKLLRETNRLELLNEEELARYSIAPPVISEEIKLEPTVDFRQRTISWIPKEMLSPGCYAFVVKASYHNMKEGQQLLQCAIFWISRLGLVLEDSASGHQGWIVDYYSGEPIPNVEIEVRASNLNAVGTLRGHFVSDKYGRFKVDGLTHGSYWFIAKEGSHVTVSSKWVGRGYDSPPTVSERSFIFTDRAIYRPGQVVYYKGICVRIKDPGMNNVLQSPKVPEYEVIQDREIELVLKDPNHQEVRRVLHKTTSMGSFFGQIVIPEGRVTGRYIIEVVRGPQGVGFIQVEEYKRPRFMVELAPETKIPTLNQTVRIKGIAQAYAGYPIDDGTVRYKVTRSGFIPWWSKYLYRVKPVVEKQLAHGKLSLNKDGTFIIEFIAEPDPSIPEDAGAYFTFNINVEVTDRAGETRTATHVLLLGYRKLNIEIEAPEVGFSNESLDVTVLTKSLIGEPIKVPLVVLLARLIQPDKPLRAPLIESDSGWYKSEAEYEFEINPISWPVLELIGNFDLHSNEHGVAKLSLDLKPGIYRIAALAQDSDGKEVKAFSIIRVINKNDKSYPIREPFLVYPFNQSVEPSNEFKLLWASGYEQARAMIEIIHRGRTIAACWSPENYTQWIFTYPVGEELKGGFLVNVWQVKEGRFYRRHIYVDVPWSEKYIKLSWESFRSKLTPKERIMWSLKISSTDPSKPIEKGQVELLATMYDRALDQFLRLHWPSLDLFYRDRSWISQSFENKIVWTLVWRAYEELPLFLNPWIYPQYDPLITRTSIGSIMYKMPRREALGLPATLLPQNVVTDGSGKGEGQGIPLAPPGTIQPQKELITPETEGLLEEKDRIIVRSFLQETAFFYPTLLNDEDGSIRIEFEAPEALTKWRVLCLAHDKKLRFGTIEAEAITKKDLMVMPNPPRFIREGDILLFPVKIVSTADQVLDIKVKLDFYDEFEHKMTEIWLLDNNEKELTLQPNSTTTCFWKIKAPNRPDIYKWRIIARSENFSDGEENFIPVLSTRIVLTESLPLFTPGGKERTFILSNLYEKASSTNISHIQLKVQIASNPIWYAIMALPYLHQFQYECADHQFNAYFALCVGKDLISRYPKVKEMIKRWIYKGELKSLLEKNQELKSILLEETPWLIEAKKQTTAMQELAMFLEPNLLERDLKSVQARLLQMQLPNGMWPWFPGGPPSPYITLYITAGYARLRDLGIEIELTPALRAINALDKWFVEKWKEDKKDNQLTVDAICVLYIYTRVFFTKEVELHGETELAFNEYLKEAKSIFINLPWLCQGYLALALYELKDFSASRAIARYILEHSVSNEELGRYWTQGREIWRWEWAHVETEALLMEVIAKILNDIEAVNECRIWLLKQKQTRAWPTSKATTQIVYSLLMLGENWLENQELAQVKIGNEWFEPKGQDRSLGFYEIEIPTSKINKDHSKITIFKKAGSPGWGGVFWQYSEEISTIKGYAQGPLTIERSLFIKRTGSAGDKLIPIEETEVHVGDELISRIIIRTDRDLEFVHIKELRPSGAEPGEAISGYRWEGGLGYYLSIKDSSTHYFIDILPRGTYVLESKMYLQHAGRYQAGLTIIECMYAPEFRAHSSSSFLEVK